MSFRHRLVFYKEFDQFFKVLEAAIEDLDNGFPKGKKVIEKLHLAIKELKQDLFQGDIANKFIAKLNSAIEDYRNKLSSKSEIDQFKEKLRLLIEDCRKKLFNKTDIDRFKEKLDSAIEGLNMRS
jgi:hypothetical protein